MSELELRCPQHGGIDHNADEGWHEHVEPHAWTDWAPSMVDALLEYRLCPICGGMEQQWIKS